jgi:hypothetical protein
MIFEYSVQKTFNEAIDVVDIGNTALRCTGRKLDNYYIILKTIMGKTSILSFGPVYPELDCLCNDFSVTYKKIDYKEAAISKEITKFINDFRKDITVVEEVTEYEAWNDFPAIQQYFENA